jgi:hypothetical protein
MSYAYTVHRKFVGYVDSVLTLPRVSGSPSASTLGSFDSFKASDLDRADLPQYLLLELFLNYILHSEKIGCLLTENAM